MRALLWWYDWGIWVGLLVAIAVLFAILYDARRKMLSATTWLVVAIVGTVLMLPSLYVTLATATAARLLVQNPNLLVAFGWIGILGFLVSVGGGVGYMLWQSGGRALPGGYPPMGPSYPGSLPPTAVGGSLPPTAGPLPPTAVPPITAARGAQPVPPVDRTQRMGRQPEPTAWLVARGGPRAGKQFGLSPSLRNTIGRDGTRCDLIVDDPAASGEHARIQWEHGMFVIYDLASTNGTWVNNRRTQRQSLMDGDVIRIGDTTLVFKSVT